MDNYTDLYFRTWGNKDVKKVEVNASNNALTIEVDDVTYELILTQQSYAWDDVPRKSELANQINTQLKKLSAKVECYVGGVSKDTKIDCLIFKTTDFTQITNVTGTFANAFFL